MLEGYFVRTLGMHRVYNSAFMHMLRDERNAEYRALIKETLAFDPEVLKRFVNFLNNPDERTAVDQFGDDDRYFCATTLLATLPGLPMFGHGQIEGYAEKYGMEFRRARWHEEPKELARRAPRARDLPVAPSTPAVRRGARLPSLRPGDRRRRGRGRLRLQQPRRRRSRPGPRPQPLRRGGGQPAHVGTSFSQADRAAVAGTSASRWPTPSTCHAMTRLGHLPRPRLGPRGPAQLRRPAPRWLRGLAARLRAPRAARLADRRRQRRRPRRARGPHRLGRDRAIGRRGRRWDPRRVARGARACRVVRCCSAARRVHRRPALTAEVDPVAPTGKGTARTPRRATTSPSKDDAAPKSSLEGAANTQTRARHADRTMAPGTDPPSQRAGRPSSARLASHAARVRCAGNQRSRRVSCRRHDQRQRGPDRRDRRGLARASRRPCARSGIDDFMARIDPRLLPWVVFLRAHAAVSRALEAELEAEQSMSLADYEALIQLAHADGRRLRMSELADRMILTRSGISRLVDRLEAGRYVERVACSTDARGAYAMLTDGGLRAPAGRITDAPARRRRRTSCRPSRRPTGRPSCASCPTSSMASSARGRSSDEACAD